MGACAMPDTDSFRMPDSSNLFRRLSVTNYADKPLPPVTAADLVDADGRCAGAYVPAASGDQPGRRWHSRGRRRAVDPAAITLEMTECDVVKRAGIPNGPTSAPTTAASAPRRSPTSAAISPAFTALPAAGLSRWNWRRRSRMRR